MHPKKKKRIKPSTTRKVGLVVEKNSFSANLEKGTLGAILKNIASQVLYLERKNLGATSHSERACVCKRLETQFDAKKSSFLNNSSNIAEAGYRALGR